MIIFRHRRTLHTLTEHSLENQDCKIDLVNADLDLFLWKFNVSYTIILHTIILHLKTQQLKNFERVSCRNDQAMTIFCRLPRSKHYVFRPWFAALLEATYSQSERWATPHKALIAIMSRDGTLGSRH